MSSKKRKKRYEVPSKDEPREPKKKKKPSRLPKGKLKDDLKRWDQTDWEIYSDEL
jgi:hypothetical protein